jgi:hypothetical protein
MIELAVSWLPCEDLGAIFAQDPQTVRRLRHVQGLYQRDSPRFRIIQVGNFVRNPIRYTRPTIQVAL